MNNELYHYGILGMKWGVRRFQNEDGSYTEAGKKRYGIGSLFGFGKSDKPKYTDKELYDLAVKDPNSIDYERIDHKKQGSITEEGLRFVADVALHGTLLNAPYRIQEGAKFVSTFFNVQKQKVENLNNPVDPATGFKLKDREYTKEEDLKRVNPGFNDFNTNTKNNCMLCTVTTELRRRGYEVTANKAGFGYFTQDLERWFPGVEVKDYTPSFSHNNPSMPFGNYTSGDVLYQDVEQQILTDNQEGSRGNFIVEFYFGGGHSIFYEIENSALVLRDGQTGETYKKEELKNIFQYCTNIQWARLDNLDFDPEEIKECCR